MNIHEFGAKNDCVTDDTHALSRLFHKFVPSLLLAGFLSACSVGNASRDDIASHIATAEQYVTIAIAAADTCVAARVPFCVANVGKIDEAKSVAREALAEAKAIAATDATQAQTLLRVAMNAVLLFYSFR